MTPDLEPWDDARLVEAKRAYRELGPSEAQLARMLGTIATAPAPVDARLTHWLKSKIGKLTLGVLTLGGIGLLALPSAAPPHRPLPVVATPAPAPAPEPEAPTPDAARTEPAREPESVQPAARSRPRAEAPKREPARAPDPIAELSLLQRARRVMPRDPTRALALADEHARSHPAGLLAEERELLAVEALLRQARRSEAERRAARFARRHPTSVHKHRMEVLLQKAVD